VTVRRLAVVGTGLIGASVGLAAKRAGVERVAGFDADREALAAALGRDAIDVAAEGLADAAEGAELVVVATPVRTIPQVVAAVSGVAGERCTITDVGSTKGRICAELSDVPNFVGGHPLCGSEAAGPEAARADLFDEATWFLADVPATDRASREQVNDFVAALGGHPVEIDPSTHDRFVALVSHLPHALANLLVALAGAAEIEGVDPLAAAGAAFRDMTRVAGANPRVWTDIFLENRELLAAAFGEYRGRIEELEEAVRAGDADAVRRSIEEAAAHRSRLYPHEGDGRSGP
jgi:prephenate dehydrogenase